MTMSIKVHTGHGDFDTVPTSQSRTVLSGKTRSKGGRSHSETGDMRSVIIAAIGWLALVSNCQAQNCVLSGSNKVGTIIQNCGPTPRLILLKPLAGQPIGPIDGPQGTFLYQVLVKIVGLIDLRVVACGDDVTDVHGRPDQSGVVSVSVLNGLPKNCVGKQLNQISSGTWRLEAISKSKNKPVQIQAVVGDFTKLL
jgi:hypothetical protein